MMLQFLLQVARKSEKRREGTDSGAQWNHAFTRVRDALSGESFDLKTSEPRVRNQ
jgi:hypothetical protein